MPRGFTNSPFKVSLFLQFLVSFSIFFLVIGEIPLEVYAIDKWIFLVVAVDTENSVRLAVGCLRKRDEWNRVSIAVVGNTAAVGTL